VIALFSFIGKYAKRKRVPKENFQRALFSLQVLASAIDYLIMVRAGEF
jgi:hypothetical protein